MGEELKQMKPGKKDLRNFAVTLGIGFSCLGLLFWRRQHGLYLPFFFIAAVLFFFGLFLPGLLKPVQKLWMELAFVSGWVMTRIILTILFFLVITPISLVLKLLGKDILKLKFVRTADSYWLSVKNIEFDKKSYENQF